MSIEPFTEDELQAQLKALKKARASGALRTRVTYGTYSKEFYYRSDNEMLSAIADLEKRLGSAPQQPRNIVVHSTKGW